MGLIASSFRMMYLTAYKITLETKIQWIASAKMELVASSDEIMALGNDLDPDNPAVKQLEARRDKLIIWKRNLICKCRNTRTGSKWLMQKCSQLKVLLTLLSSVLSHIIFSND